MPIYVRLALRSFFHQRTKALLMLGSLLFCLISIGTLLNSKYLFQELLENSRQTSNLADITFYTGRFDQDIDFVSSIEGVKHAEAKTEVRSRAKLHGEYMNLQLLIVPNDSRYSINQTKLIDGDPLRNQTIWIEKATAEDTGLKQQEKMDIILPSQTKGSALTVAGVVQDHSRIPAKYSGIGYGFISEATAEKWNIPLSKNMIHVKLEDGSKQKEMVKKLQKSLEDNGITVYRSETSSETFFIRETMVDSLLNIFILLGLFAFVLGFILIVHIFHRIISEDIYSLSIQKVTGATYAHLWKQYLLLIFLIGTVISTLSIPISSVASRYFVSYLGAELNFGRELTQWISPPLALGLLLLSFIIPLFGAIVPVRSLLSSPMVEGLKGSGRLQMKASGRSRRRFFHLSLLSIRNILSKKGQSILNILMLSFGGAVIIACFSMQESLGHTMDEMDDFWHHDVEWSVSSPLPKKEITSLAESIDGVKTVEGWTKRNTEVKDASSSDYINALLYSLPATSEFIKPELVKGRWLNPEHPDDIVVNSELAEKLGPVSTGDTVSLQIGKEKKEWRVAGIIKSSLTGPSVYMVQPSYQSWLGQETINRLMVEKKDGTDVHSLLNDGEDVLSSNGIRIEGSETVESMNARPKEIIKLVLLTIACIGWVFSIVGIVNLMIAVSMNIYERTQEIGIMKSLGGSNAKVYGLFIGESTIVAVLGWGLSCAMSYPLNWLLGWKLGDSLLHFTIDPHISLKGSMIWLCISLLIGFTSSVVPLKKTLKQKLTTLL
ncbi:ABC transporter permease [Rossellomorea aquimaris]|uniref:ABC transporter permease n=1 Tax=Rossellomorea aquimaris TaxID=189382 RepID=UPI001CD780B3|nr:FtsX-like permease family protein [Rossellomorea aquimaris]MCA1060259.1 ABC transporter permease [Rossellomorea aquimaris]